MSRDRITGRWLDMRWETWYDLILKYSSVKFQKLFLVFSMYHLVFPRWTSHLFSTLFFQRTVLIWRTTLFLCSFLFPRLCPLCEFPFSSSLFVHLIRLPHHWKWTDRHCLEKYDMSKYVTMQKIKARFVLVCASLHFKCQMCDWLKMTTVCFLTNQH